MTFVVSFFGHSPDLLERRAITIPGLSAAARNCSRVDHGHLAEKKTLGKLREDKPPAQ